MAARWRSSPNVSAIAGSASALQPDHPVGGEFGMQVGQQLADGAQHAGVARHQYAGDAPARAPAAPHAAARRRRTPPACRPRGSSPRSAETSRTASAKVAVTADTMACAAAGLSMPSVPASAPIAAWAKSWRSREPPPGSASGFSVCSTRLASVTVGPVSPSPLPGGPSDQRRPGPDPRDRARRPRPHHDVRRRRRTGLQQRDWAHGRPCRSVISRRRTRPAPPPPARPPRRRTRRPAASQGQARRGIVRAVAGPLDRLLDAPGDAARRVVRRGRHLPDPDPAGRVVEQANIREGGAGIHADPPGHRFFPYPDPAPPGQQTIGPGTARLPDFPSAAQPAG